MYPVLPRDKLHEMLVILLDNCQKNAESMRLWPDAVEHHGATTRAAESFCGRRLTLINGNSGRLSKCLFSASCVGSGEPYCGYNKVSTSFRPQGVVNRPSRNSNLTQQTLQERTLSTALRAPLVRARLTRTALADLETKSGKPNASMRPFKNYEESAMNLASGSVGGPNLWRASGSNACAISRKRASSVTGFRRR